VMALKQPVLAAAARCFFEQGDEERRAGYRAYLQQHPLAADYAAFQTAGEGSHDYHLYCQWEMDRQLAALAVTGGAGLMFDLPLGVHPEGFDAMRFPGLFVAGVSTGAPPDGFFTKGQDWDTPPLDVWGDRRGGYAYFRACLANLMRHASALRVDHLMSFHRLFWIPEGLDAKDGVYVRNPAEELYAVLSCESHTHRAEVLGEDLGTVPAGVRVAMRRHGLARTWVFPAWSTW